MIMKIHMSTFDDGCPKLVVEHTIEELKNELGEIKGDNLLLKSENKKYYEIMITEKDLLDVFFKEL